MSAPAGPWELALGPQVESLSPELRAYVAAPPPGRVGVGEGHFDVVGTPRRALAPLVALLGAMRVLWAVRGSGIPFTVRNRLVDGALLADRRVRVGGREHRQVDRVTAAGGEAIDRLGRGGLVEVRFRASTTDGGMRLESTRVALRIGRLRLPAPAVIAPRAQLAERTVERAGRRRQRVEFEITAPLLGAVYRYAGDFDYRIEAA